jgi:hypothetical protein
MKKQINVNQYIKNLNSLARELVETIRRIIFEANPGMKEEIKWNIPTYSNNGLVYLILPAKEQISLGFYRGIELSDPEKMLSGTGMRMRAIKID